MSLDYQAARQLLAESFERVQDRHVNGEVVEPPPAAVAEAIVVLFRSSTQAYREALLGCATARLLDLEIDLILIRF